MREFSLNIDIYLFFFNFLFYFFLSSCIGKKACEIIANRATFGEPCQQDIHVLEVNYECVESNFWVLMHF